MQPYLGCCYFVYFNGKMSSKKRRRRWKKRKGRAHLLQMKRDDLYIPATRLMHDHLRCHDGVWVPYTSQEGAGSGGWPRPSIDATVDESAPVARITFLKQRY